LDCAMADTVAVAAQIPSRKLRQLFKGSTRCVLTILLFKFNYYNELACIV
jgi:hypothetical protein